MSDCTTHQSLPYYHPIQTPRYTPPTCDPRLVDPMRPRPLVLNEQPYDSVWRQDERKWNARGITPRVNDYQFPYGSIGYYKGSTLTPFPEQVFGQEVSGYVKRPLETPMTVPYANYIALHTPQTYSNQWDKDALQYRTEQLTYASRKYNKSRYGM